MKSPALALTPEETNLQITAAGSAGRTEDRRAIAAAQQTIEEVATKLGRQLESHVMADEQRRRLWRVGLAGLVAGMAVWAILVGPIARDLPASWLLPERMAARTLRLPMWESGQELMKAGKPPATVGALPTGQYTPAQLGAPPVRRGKLKNSSEPLTEWLRSR